MILLPGGRFEVGINRDEIPKFENVFHINAPQLFEDEVPKHEVRVTAFSIDRYLVSNSDFKKFVEANPKWAPDHISTELDNGNYLKHWKASGSDFAKPDRPVVNVNWYAAAAYCNWVGKRLPSEAEWEYAARSGGRSVLFPWGNDPADTTRANYIDSKLLTTSAVGAYPPNEAGIFDMAGNVWQFLADEWHPYPSLPQVTPVADGNSAGDRTAFLRVMTRRVIRGGSFGGAPVNLWVEYRDSHPPNGSREFVGFRCAK